MNVHTNINQQILNDIMTKTAQESWRLVERSCDLLRIVGIASGESIIAVIQASATPGIKALFEVGAVTDNPITPGRVAAGYVILAALEARTREIGRAHV